MAYHPQTLLQQFIKLMLRFTLLFSVMLVLVACASQQQVSYQQRQYLLGKENFATGNYEVAFYQLLPAAKEGDARAQYAIGYMYFYGKGVTKDLMMAQHWMRLSAQQGYPDAARALSVIDHMLAAQNPVFSLPAPSLKMVPDY